MYVRLITELLVGSVFHLLILGLKQCYQNFQKSRYLIFQSLKIRQKLEYERFYELSGKKIRPVLIVSVSFIGQSRDKQL